MNDDLTQLGVADQIWSGFEFFDCDGSTHPKRHILNMTAFFCSIFPRVYP